MPVEGVNRINVKLYHDQGTLCVNARGPLASPAVKQAVLDQFETIAAGDWVLVCGNMMRGLDEDFLIELADRVHRRQGKLVIDMEALTPALIRRCSPALVNRISTKFKLWLNQPSLTLKEFAGSRARSCWKPAWKTC